MRCGDSPAENIAKAESLARQAAGEGARIILLPELFERPYFCKTQRPEFLDRATPADENPAVRAMLSLSAELGALVPASFYERAGQALFNSLAIIDCGNLLGVYRKSHIPDGPGYQEKFYFSPGDTGFKAWPTSHGNIGAAICWDQWFPEAARAMALAGADILLYPTAIGDEPHAPGVNSAAHWRAVMQGHAAANMTAVAAANRIGKESQADAFGNAVEMSFYGQSFISDARGQIVAQASADREEVICADIDFDADRQARREWSLFRDRRPDLYRPLLSLEGA